MVLQKMTIGPRRVIQRRKLQYVYLRAPRAVINAADNGTDWNCACKMCRGHENYRSGELTYIYVPQVPSS